MMSGMEDRRTTNIWTAAADTATDMDNLIIRPGETENSYQKFYGDKKKCFTSGDNLKTFGEEVIVADRTKIKAKLRDRGIKCFWLGYAKNRSSDTYRLYNPKTQKIILSRDVIFLNREKEDVIKTPSKKSKDIDPDSHTEDQVPIMTWS